MKKGLITLVVLLCANIMLAQTTIKGSVYDIYLEPLASIIVSSDKGSITTDAEGGFALVVKQTLPLKLTVSGVGFQTQTLDIVDFEEINVVLEKKSKFQEIVVSASRTPERVLESPVTIERVGISDVKNGTSLNFYDNLVNLRDVDVHSSGFGVKSINTRAFASIDNSRFVQLVDGADSANPSFNFSLGNTMGLNELDVAGVEILPGAASALYGANAFNGILIMNSKNPFDYSGISVSLKSGITNQDGLGKKAFYDTSIRMAHAFSNKLGVKANFNFLRAEEWEANDSSNTNGFGGDIIEGDRSDSDYDGLNVYGDETTVNFKDGLTVLESFGLFPTGTSQLLPSFVITRDGFNETDLTDGDVKTIAFDASLYYRPFGKEDVEFVFNSKYGYGDNSFIKGNSRIHQKGAFNQQHKVDFKYKSLLSARAYYSNFQQGENSHNLLLLGGALNTDIKAPELWFTEYISVFTTTYLNAIDNNLTSSQAQELGHAQARGFANLDSPVVGTDEFTAALNASKQTLVSDGGARLQNNSHLYHGDLNLNFTEFIEVFGLQMGGSYRSYKLNSSGQLYTDAVSSPIVYDEFGIYAQANKKVLDKRLALSTSVRYDKSKNFEGNFSPRVSITYAAGENRSHNFRASYQTAFRNPTSEDQYGGSSVGSRLFALGNIEENYGRYISAGNVLSPGSPGVALLGSTTATLTGDDIINNSFTLESEQAYNNALNSAVDNNEDLDDAYLSNLILLETAVINPLAPEKVQTLELGYRGQFDVAGSIFEVDFNSYYSKFDNFIKTQIVSTPFYGDVNATTDTSAGQALNSLDYARYAIRVNSLETLDFYGAGVTIGTQVLDGFDLSANYMFAELKNQEEIEETVQPGFNTAKHRVKASFGKEEVIKNLGFKVNARWQSAFLWQSAYLSQEIDSRFLLDAQVNLSVPQIKSNFKLGGTNLLGKEYVSAPGLGGVGSVYYVNWTINN